MTYFYWSLIPKNYIKIFKRIKKYDFQMIKAHIRVKGCWNCKIRSGEAWFWNDSGPFRNKFAMIRYVYKCLVAYFKFRHIFTMGFWNRKVVPKRCSRPFWNFAYFWNDCY